jgi:hypothetical protein
MRLKAATTWLKAAATRLKASATRLKASATWIAAGTDQSKHRYHDVEILIFDRA